MKKIISILMAFVLCFGLAACGGTGNADQDYVLSLMERGDYDMAISVLEGLRDKAAGMDDAAPAQPVGDEETEGQEDKENASPSQPDTEEISPSQPDTEVEVFVPNVEAGMQQLVIDVVKQFMAAKGDAMVEGYVTFTSANAREPSVAHAMEYKLADWDGFEIHFMMVCLNADIAYTDDQGQGCINDRVYILCDMQSGKIYDSTMLTDAFFDSFSGTCTSVEEVCLLATNAYQSFIMNNAEQLWSEMEICEELNEADLAGINEALN